MKRILISISLSFLIAQFAKGQTPHYKVVFDLSSRDSVNQQALIREIGLIKGASPEANIEVVIYGQGLDLVITDRSAQRAAVEKIIDSKMATFKVCALTMKRNNVGKDQILPGVEIVPDGIYEMISRQQDGWGYVKVGH
jgi:uncharacterized protein